MIAKTLLILAGIVLCAAVVTEIRKKPPYVEPGYAKPQEPLRKACSERAAYKYGLLLKQIAEQEKVRAWMDDSLGAHQAAWLMSKAEYAIAKSNVFKSKTLLSDKSKLMLEDTYLMLLRACHQSRFGVKDIEEEKGSRLRAYISEIDQTIQTYSISIPKIYDASYSWPLIVSMHGHGWYAPFQGHPAPVYPGVFCLSPQGRGATDYKDIGEDDVMQAIAEVKKYFNIDDNRVYLTGTSMGGTGSYHLATRYADQFAAIMPIVGNADNEAWTKVWGWNRKFPGRYDDLRKWIQDGHTARAFAENLISLPAFIFAGAADFVVPPDHSRNMVEILRKYGANVQYREYPGVGHGGFPKDALADGLAWTCSWVRNPYPKSIYWKADQLKYGKCHWIRMEQMEQPLKTAAISATIDDNGRLSVRTSNLLAFSFQRPNALFSQTGTMNIHVNGTELALDNLPREEDKWICIRNDVNHGWCDARTLQMDGLTKHKGLEGPINEVLNSPFMLVVGTTSQEPGMNEAWMREAQKFASEWKRRNNQSCLMMLDTQCKVEDMQKRNIILFGSGRDNAVSELIEKTMPITEVMANLPMKNIDPQDGSNPLDAPDFGSIILYPNLEFAPERLVVRLAANKPEAAYQLWGRFGNWFNWGVFDSKKYFDYAVFDSRTSSPETFLLLGWYGTDWRVESGKYFIGDEDMRNGIPPMQFPKYASVPDDVKQLPLAELMPAKTDQMRGAIGIGRGFFGETLPLENSLGMRAPCTIEYDIDGRYQVFTAEALLLNSSETNMCQVRENGEKIRFTIYGDGKKLTEVIVDWKKPRAPIKANVSKVKMLKLEAVPAGGPSWLHSGSAWLQPSLN